MTQFFAQFYRTPGGGFGSAGASRFGSSASRFGNGASSRFGNGGGVASFQNRLSSSSGASRGSFGNVGSSSSSSAVRGAQNTFASNNGVTSQFASNSFQNSENARIAAIGISSSFLPPLAEDSEEFGGFDAPVSTFGGNDNSLRNNFVSTSVSQNGFGGSQASNAFTNQGGSNANRFTGSVSSSNQRVGIRPTTSTTSVISAGNAFGVSSAPSFVQSPVQSSNSDFGSSRLSSSSSSQSSNNGFVKGLGNGATSDGDYKVLRHESEANEDGYHYVYETENQIQAEETGRLLNKGTDDAHIEATGFFEYVGPDGVTYRVDYTADENGFQATVRV